MRVQLSRLHKAAPEIIYSGAAFFIKEEVGGEVTKKYRKKKNGGASYEM